MCALCQKRKKKSLLVPSPSTRQSSNHQTFQEVSACPSNASLAPHPPHSVNVACSRSTGRCAPSVLCTLAQGIPPLLAGLSFQPCPKSHSLSTYLIRPHSHHSFWGACQASSICFAHFLPDKPSCLSSRSQWFTTSLWPRDHTLDSPHCFDHPYIS